MKRLWLNRFTTIPVLLDLLKRKKLVLLDPTSWDDKNDFEIMKEYANRKNNEKVFAICFSCGDETIHHWKTYADGISGCCIQFDKVKLLNSIPPKSGFRHGRIRYKKIFEIEKKPVPLNLIPFTKRWPYKCENEFRIIWEGETKNDFVEINIELNIINKITISQQMPKQVFNTIKRLLKEESCNPESIINRSTLYENRRWINCFK